MDRKVENLVKELNKTLIVNQDLTLPDIYSIVAKFDDDIDEKLAKFIDEVRKIEGDHLFYDKRNFHITLYGPISSGLDVGQFVNFLTNRLAGEKVSFELVGMARTGIIAKPIGFSLESLRKDVRKFLNIEEKSGSFENLSWSILWRFKHQPSEKLLEFLDKNWEREFGVLKAEKVYLIRTNCRVIDVEKSKVSTIEISKKR